MIKRLFILLLLVAGISFAFANEMPILREMPKTNVTPEEYVNQVELDSIRIYKELIAQEDEESSCVMDVVGVVVGSGLTSVGAGLVGLGLYALFSNSDPQSLDESSKGFAGTLLILASVQVFLLGIPVIVNNVGDYKTHKKHAIKRDEYKEALDRYKVRMQQEGWKSVQLMVVPTLNVAKASFGANAILLF